MSMWDPAACVGLIECLGLWHSPGQVRKLRPQEAMKCPPTTYLTFPQLGL